MSIRTRVAATAVILVSLAGWLFAQAPRQDMPAVLQQLQDTLKRLQAEVKSLRETVQRQANEAKKNKAPAVQAPAPAPAKPASSLQIAIEAYNRGRSLEEKNMLRGAIEAYGEAILADPGNDSAWLRRGNCFLKLGEYSSAEADYTKSLAVQPNNSQAYMGRASARLAAGLTKSALGDVNEAILRDDHNPESFVLRARLNELEGDAQRATADYSMAISLVPAAGTGETGNTGIAEKAYLGRASALLTRGEVDRALSDCDTAIRLNPNSSPGYLCRAESYLRLRSPELAVEAVNRAVLISQLTNQPVPLLSYLGPSFAANPSRGGALAAAATPVPAPESPVSAPPPSAILSALTVPLPSMRSLPESVVVSPLASSAPVVKVGSLREAERLDQLGREHTSKENFEEALAMMNRAVSINPQYARAFNARGYVHLRLTHYPQAVADFSEAIRLDPRYANAYHNRAVARRLMGEIAEANSDEREAKKFLAPVALSASR